MKVIERPKKMLPARINKVFRLKRNGIFRITDMSHAKVEATSKRASVTSVVYANGCFMAKYRSPHIQTRWKSEAITRPPVTGLATRSKQYPVGSSSNNITATAMYIGCTSIPTAKSVEASIASKMFDLWALSRDFTLTAIITSAFKAAVKGKVSVLMKMMKIKNA